MKVRSPLRYPGGKSRAVERIARLIPSFNEFREPFVGGGSVFISLKLRFPRRKFWVNDKYEELATFWTVLQNDSESLFTQIWNWKDEFSDGRTLYTFLRENMRDFSEIQNCRRVFCF